MRQWLACLLVLSMLLNTAIAPIAYAADPATPEQAAANRQIDERTAELDRAIDEEAKELPASPARDASVAALHQKNHDAQAQAKELTKQKGVVGYFKSLDAAGWVRHVLGGFKAITRSSTVAGAAVWAGGIGSIATGTLLTGTAAGIELGATVFEMPIGAKLQNFPYNTERLNHRPGFKEVVATIQGAINSTLVFWVANPALTQSLAAMNSSEHPYPTLFGAAMGFLAGIGQSTAYVIGFRGASNLEAKGWLHKQVKSILFALTGMVGFYAGLRLASGDPAQQAAVFKMLLPIWGVYLATGLGSIFVPKRAKVPCKDSVAKL